MNAPLSLNPEQTQAVTHTEGPVLILAGAGSGKTRVLTQRIAYLISECGIRPWEILAITFTNKAAKELRERVRTAAGEGAQGVTASTFHAACVRILRRNAELLGYDAHFSIYDSDDSRTLMKQIVKRYQLETRDFKLRNFLNAVSRAKDTLIDPANYLITYQYDLNAERVSRAYTAYQKALQEANAFDFDDLIMKTVELFQKYPEVLEEYQNRWRYISVDEYQDTNNAQFELIRLLSAKYRNLCVVGDDDQSIYRFRGANIRNILDFEQVFPDAFTVKLEQNYRSTGHILSAANGVIRNNRGRKDKSLWSDLGDGAPVRFRLFSTAYEEADFVSDEVARLKREGHADYADIAVLYRTNAQSRLLEERFVREGIPYELVGGVNFYARREIKDILAYLKTVDNARDDLAVMRIINVPKRGIGQTTVEKIADYAALRNLSFYDALTRAADIVSGATLKKIEGFLALIEDLREYARDARVEETIAHLIDLTEYEDYLYSLQEDTGFEDEENERVENVGELLSKASDYDETAEEGSLSGFLAEVALVADIDLTDDTIDRALLMTLHAAKGLEFPRVYLTGMEEDVFPSYQACQAEEIDRAAMEEERRLAYVGLTRAKEHLTLTASRMRTTRGETHYNAVSRFVAEIPKEVLDIGEGAEEMLSQKSYRVQTSADTASGMSATSGKSALQYMKALKTPSSVSFQKGMPAGTKPDYAVGDRVRHIKFGEGTVTELTEEVRDYKVTVDFADYGQKVMYAAFAKLVRV